MATLLLELFSEEIPSRMQRAAAEQLQRLISAGFEKNMLTPSSYKTFVSPRHLAIQCYGLPTIQPDVKEEKRGPKIGAPEQALKGFLSASGLTLDQCEQRDGYYYAIIERKGRAVAEVVKEICESALTSFGWPKSMRWGSRPLNWVRPLHRIACLLDDEVIQVQFAHLTASNVTEGHRFLKPAPITLTHAEDYEEHLNAAKVMVDYAARRAEIKTKITALAASAKLSLVEDEALLDEVTGLVEWPVPLLCQFDKKFLDLPPEVLISEMKNHQRYFALNDASGKLSDQFITVANMETKDGGKRVKEGNARVVRARLADGEFYWEQDRKTNLEHWGKKLSDVVFHAKVGMMNEKVERIEALAVAIAKAVNFTDEKSVRRGAQLCKADLTSGMVGEFPELQGIMGRYYATAQGETQEIADAIRDHYKPVGATDSEPKSELAAIISLADKLDSIVRLFAAGEKPTGSKDPLALRRAALGVLRILHYHRWNLDLAAFCNAEVVEFFHDRLKNLMRDEQIPAHVIEAGLKMDTNNFVPAMLSEQTKNLAQWVDNDTGKSTIAAIKRVLNILAAEEKKSKSIFAANTSGAKEPSEKSVANALTATPKTPKDLELLTAPINQFFTDLLVNEEGHRDARLALLASVREAANHIADFSKIEG
ncbi:MAG: glycine--tRNA ligase subunit beta [Rickettsiales bacterium]